MGEVTAHAHLVEASSADAGKGGGAIVQEKQHCHVQTEAETHEAGRARLPAGWVVASWRVE